jgi:hypothetical protein
VPWTGAGAVSGAVQHLARGFTSRIARRFPLVTLCLYDARRFTSLDVVEALRVHPDLLDYPADRVID